MCIKAKVGIGLSRWKQAINLLLKSSRTVSFEMYKSIKGIRDLSWKISERFNKEVGKGPQKDGKEKK